MHNLFLGIVKTLWYNQWIQTSALCKSTDKRARELDVIHRFLAMFEVSLWAGKLPSRVGEPAGGSLSADEYKLAATYTWPIIILIVWETYLVEATEDYNNAKKRFPKAQEAHNKKLDEWKARKAGASSMHTSKKRKVDAEPKPPKDPHPHLHPDEPINLLRLSTALKIFCGSSISEDLLPRASTLFQDFLFEYQQLYGAKAMKPNFHWAVHLEEQIRDFGPVYNFWTFLSEQLNKLLKSSNLNNWTTGGQLEISMMREFLRGMHMEALAHMVINKSQIAVEKTIFEQILGKGDEAVGTVQDVVTEDVAMEREIINDELQSLLRVQCGPPASTMQEKLSDLARLTLLRAYNATHPQVHFILDCDPPPQTVPLHDYAVFYCYGLLDGRCITPASQSKCASAGSSLVKVDFDGQSWYGEIVNILQHPQHGVPGTVTETLLAEFCWMKEVPLSPVNDDPWSDLQVSACSPHPIH
ncbi:hypothetical protein DFH29DRAFT_881990 [Suillus ampliporus]|nr:hypothetical protein DFH29DRAFT_881990 [Suillus ampliporus]